MDKNKIIQAATKYVQKGQFDKAIAEYQKVIREDPRDVRVLLKVGELHQKRGDNALAASMLLQVAESYSGDGFFLKAVAVYKQILKLDPSRVDVNVRLAELYQQLGLMSDAMGQFQIVANHHDREGRLTELADVLRRMVDLDPENVASRIKLAEMFARQGATRDAITEFRKAAVQLKNAGRPDDYVKVGERIVFLDPSDVVLARELASVHLARGDTKRALAKLQACFKTDPHDVETLTLLARAFHDLGQTSKTIAVYKELARIHGEAERVDDERATWRRVLELDPDDPDARAAVAHSRPAPQPLVPDAAPAPESPAPPPGEVAARPPPSPRPPAASSPRASPGDPVGKLLTETDVYVKYGLHDKALEHLRKIFQLDPTNLEAHEKAAELLLTAGNQTVGLEELVTVCRLCVERGEIERGRAHFAHLAHLAPHLPAVAELQAALAAGAPPVDDDAIVIEAADDLVEESNLDEHGEDVIIGEVEEEGGIEIVSDVEEIDDATRDMLLPDVASSEEEEVVLAPEPEPEPGELVDEPLFGGQMAEEELTGEIDLALSQGPQESTTPGPEEGSGTGWDVHSESQLTAYAATPGPEEVVADPEVEATFAAADGAQAPVVEEGIEGEEVGEEIELSSEPAPTAWSAPEYEYEPEPELAHSGYEEPEEPQEPPPEELPEAPEEAATGAPEAFEAPLDEPANPWGLDADDLAEIETELQEAEFFIAQDLLDEAEEACTSILFRAPGHPVATARLAEIEAMRGGPLEPGPVEVASSFDLAAELASQVGPEQPTDLDEFQYSVEDVLEEFKRGVSQTVKPEDTQTHYDLGIAYKEMGLLQEAIGEFEVAMQGSRGKPAEIECLHMIGLCKVALGKPLEGTGFLEQALRAPRIGAEAARAIEYELASALEACGDAPRALFHFGKVAAVDAGYRDVGQAVARLQAAGVVAAPPSEREHNGAVAPEPARPGVSARKIGYV